MTRDLDVDDTVRSWLDEGVMALPDHIQDAVLARLPTIRQRRARWPAWRLTTMATPFRVVAAATAIGILAVGVSVVPRNDGPSNGGYQVEGPSPAASLAGVSPGVLVTGTITKVLDAADEFDESVEVDFGYQERGRDSTAQATMSDLRLSGVVTARDNADRFCNGVCDQDTFAADVLWGTIEIANDGGTWVGTAVGTTDAAADGAGVTYYELSGTGAYDGLSAILFETESFPGPIFVLSGVIFPGELPPDR